MVQIIPPKTNVGNQIGQALGKGVEQGMNVGFQRGMLQGALKKVEDLGKSRPEGAPAPTPFELASALMSATAGIPGAERYVGQLFPLLLTQLQNQQFGATPGPGETSTALGGVPAPEAQRGAPVAGGTEGQLAAQSYGQAVQQRAKLPLPIPDADYNPFEGMTEGIQMGAGPVPLTHSEQQYRDVANAYRARGLDPNIAIEQMQLEDNISRQRQQDIVRGVQTEAEVQNLRNITQQRFRDALQKSMPNADQNQIALAERIGNLPHIRSIPNLNQRADATRKEVDLYEGAKNNFRNNSVRRDYDTQEHNRQLDRLAGYGKKMVDLGERAEAERILAENDWGPTEISSILNPLPESTRRGIKSLPKVEDIQTKLTVLPDDPKFEGQVRKAMDERTRTINKYQDYIRKNFETGQYDPLNVIKPGTSLLQLRDEALQQGMTFQEFENIISNLVDSGDIKLDAYQQKDLPLLAEHPIRSFGIGEILWRLNPWYIPRK